MNDPKTQATLLALHGRMLSALMVHQGTAWKEVISELHLHYNEIPVWVLLYEDSVPEESHGVFRRAIVPFLDELGTAVQMTLMYYVVRGNERFHLDFLTSTSDILSASGEALGAWQKQTNKQMWLFNSNSSQHG